MRWLRVKNGASIIWSCDRIYAVAYRTLLPCAQIRHPLPENGSDSAIFEHPPLYRGMTGPTSRSKLANAMATIFRLLASPTYS
jgi:hypothetical protein